MQQINYVAVLYTNSYTGLPEAREAAQDRVYWRMFTKHSATVHAQLLILDLYTLLSMLLCRMKCFVSELYLSSY